MAELFRVRAIFADAPALFRRVHDRVRPGAMLIFWPLALLTLISLSLQFGALHTEFKFAGPFAAETNPPRASLKVEVPQEDEPAPWWRQPLVGDDSAHPFQSFLELRIDEREAGPPHTVHETIREGNNTGFSHWGSWLIFSLPEGVDNGPGTIATLRYSVRPWASVTSALSAASALLCCLLFIRKFLERCAKLIRKGRYLISSGFRRAGSAGSAIVAGPGFFAPVSGRALPTPSAIRGPAIARSAALSRTHDVSWPRLPNIFAVGAHGRGIDRFIRIGAKLVFWPLALLTLLALTLELGVYPAELTIAGPFPQEDGPAYQSLIVEIPQNRLAMRWRQRPVGDDAQDSSRSVLEFQINGRKVQPPHSDHKAIREGATAGFSHWGNFVIFTLPPDVENTAETNVTISYPARPRRGLTLALVLLTALLGRFLYAPAVRRYARALRRAINFLSAATPSYAGRIPSLVLLGLCSLGLISSLVYVASSLYASANGWALPTTALIRWSPIARWAAVNEPYLSYLLLTLAGIGASVSWLVGLKPRHRKSVDSNEQPLLRFLALCGFPIAACALILSSSALWTGILRPGDLSYSNIGGLLPFLDAKDYLASGYDQAQGGFWAEVALRRPLSAAFRSVLLFFSNFSLPLMLVLQACLIAAATCFAASAVAAWRGIWAGLAFFALTYTYVRYFVPTTLTEPFGLFWALLSIPFFIEAFRRRSAKPALVGFALTTVALMTRMGSMLTIPALLVWLVWQFGRGAGAKLRIFAAACGILLAVLGTNSLLKNSYGTDPGTGNFSYVLCGLTMGTTWEGCPGKLASEGKPLEQGEDARAKQLYSLAWENFKANPGPFFYRIGSGARAFVTRLPDLLWNGHGVVVPEPKWLWRNSLSLVCLFGLLIAARRMTAVELTFWGLVWASIGASASLIYFDDGTRTLAASLPLIALFFSMGMSNPAAAPPRRPLPPSRLSRYGALGLTVTAALFVCVPWMAHRFGSVGETVGGPLLQKPDQAFVFGGPRMAGFLVVADDEPLRSDVPSLHLADFDAIVSRSNMEIYQELIHPVLPPLPFGFIYAPRLEKGVQSLTQFIVPAEVLERPSVPTWRFHLLRWGYKPTAGYGELWFYVTKAEPWPCTYWFREAIDLGRCRN